jgi:PhnB protein
MKSVMNPYLNFKNNAREAMQFYQSVFGGKLTMQTFKEFHASQNPSDDNLIMHGQLEAENGIMLMGADTPAHMMPQAATNFSNFSISLSGDNEPELTGYYQKLAAGGSETQPLTKAMWGDTFGMCTDKYGISWMVNITGPKA